jgi:hypothetical protein
MRVEIALGTLEDGRTISSSCRMPHRTSGFLRETSQQASVGRHAPSFALCAAATSAKALVPYRGRPLRHIFKTIDNF